MLFADDLQTMRACQIHSEQPKREMVRETFEQSAFAPDTAETLGWS
jgi:hypothetical protein